MCVVYFFFFKQKTAYEMRISDWSSDVCSSDLGIARRGQEDLERARRADGRDQVADRGHAVAQAQPAGRDGERAVVRGDAQVAAQRDVQAAGIGRASCRERVCQYV